MWMWLRDPTAALTQPGPGVLPFAQDFFDLLFEEPLPATRALEFFVVVFKEVANPLLGRWLNWYSACLACRRPWVSSRGGSES